MNTIKQIFHSPRFVVGFVIFMAILLTVIFYPIFVTTDPLEMIGQGNFFKPGTYVNVSETVSAKQYTLNVDVSSEAKLEAKLDDTQRERMADWLVRFGGVDESEIDTSNAAALVELWKNNYSKDADQTGLISADKKYFVRLDSKIDDILSSSGIIVATQEDDGTLTESSTIADNAYANIDDLHNTYTFVLGTDNFGRDVLTELVSAAKTSLKIGLIAGCIATLIGLTLGLLAGYLGGLIDNIITFVTNLFTVIPSFVLLILISYSVGKSARGVTLVAIIIGCTSWTWTTRSVRSQVISLRNRDHVNMSKLSGHSLFRIILTDILPYIASYVVMALILQISSGILSEAQLSMLGLGPATTETATLGLMMNWAMTYSAHLNGSWWAYFPVVFTIALIAFSLNLMNTGLDQVFNPQLRD
jgi:ABC-type dipeptide/oligopeptide/nickel transport system permease subunit